MTFIRLIAIAITVYFALPTMVGWAQKVDNERVYAPPPTARPPLPGAGVGQDYHRHVAAVTGYGFSDSARLFHNGRRLVCFGALNGVAARDQQASERPFCDWIVPPDMVVRMMLWQEGDGTGQFSGREAAIKSAIELLKPATSAIVAQFAHTTESSAAVVATMADGSRATVERRSVKPSTGTRWSDYSVVVLPKRGQLNLLLLAFSSSPSRQASTCNGTRSNPAKCRQATVDLLALMRASEVRVSARP